jgi:hypothetical protein
MQDVIAMPTPEAENIICCAVSREVKWLIQLHRDIQGKDASPVPINCENLGELSDITIGIVKEPTKHIDI